MKSGRVAVSLLALLVVAAPAQADDGAEVDASSDSGPAGNSTSEQGGDGAGANGTSEQGGDGAGANGTSDGNATEDTGTAGPTTDSGRAETRDSPTTTENIEAGAPCGVVYWHQRDPTRLVVDPNNCFMPIVYDLISIT